jgi:cobyrinic acid a,c-diamide synthase
MNAETTPLTHGFVVAAAWRSSGKTTVSSGLAAAARRRGLHVQCFKKGPDYIDPQWLHSASGRPCYNLDPWMQSDVELQQTYNRYRAGAELVIVEGNMGLHDGMSDDGSDSTAGLARQLGLPVVLVVDCRGMHRTVAALLDGLCRFDEHVQFAGVILNRVSGARHEQKLRRAIESQTSLSVLGALPYCADCELDERELGLTPALQHGDCEYHQTAMANLLEQGCDLNALFGASRAAAVGTTHQGAKRRGERYRIGIAQDQAFHFYYQDDLDELRRRGTELVPVSPLRDSALPQGLDGLLLGGGFPERYAGQLCDNQSFRTSLEAAIEYGLSVRAECAGLIYLCRRMHYDNRQYNMVGAIDADVVFEKKPVGRGYMRLSSAVAGSGLRAHEFHHSRLINRGALNYCYQVDRGHGVDGERDGIVVHNVVASYAHFRHTRATPWVDWFVQRIESRQTACERDYVQA